MNRRSQQSKGALALYLVIALAGCTAINVHQKPPSDWPKLQVSIQHMGFMETQKACKRNIAEVVLIGPVFGCAWVNFDDMTCRVYLASDDPLLLEHELAHCDGYDHIGGSALRDYWESWKAGRASK